MRSGTERVSVLTFANRPYADRDACWGCGLTPDVIKYGTNPMCRWCEELLRILLGRDPFWCGFDPHLLVERDPDMPVTTCHW
jgi:hypothetical protein